MLLRVVVAAGASITLMACSSSSEGSIDAVGTVANPDAATQDATGDVVGACQDGGCGITINPDSGSDSMIMGAIDGAVTPDEGGADAPSDSTPTDGGSGQG